MKSLLAAAAIALVPTFAAAGDMHAFDYKGTGNPVALAETVAQPKTTQAEAQAVIPSPMFLTRDSNYAVFVQDGVPLVIHRQAMRLLWTTNPELGRPDAGEILALGVPAGAETITVAALQQ